MEQLAHIETSLKELWEKAKQAGELITRLREEKLALLSENEDLERNIAKLRSELLAKDQQAQQLAAAHTVRESQSTTVVSNGEREQLTAKVRELLARIDAYL